MNPTVTDWIQAGASALAFGLAAASLIWQWRTARRRASDQIQLEAKRVDATTWVLNVTAQGPDRSARLTARITAPPFVTIVPDAQAAPGSSMIFLPLVHASPSGLFASGSATLLVPEWVVGGVELKVQLLADGAFRPLICKTSVVSPIA